MSRLLQNHISPLDPEALAALEARGFDAEEFLQLGLGVGLEAGSRRLAVPYREQGQVVAIRTGALEGGFSGLLGATWLGLSEPPLYNVDCLRDATLANEPLLVAEREMACWAAMVSGFRRVVGVAAVLAMDGRRQPQLETAAELMRDASEVVIATFDDEHGQKLRANIAETIGAVRCMWVNYPKGCADLLSTLRTFKARGVQETIKRAQWFAMPGFYSMSELPEPPLNPAYGTGIVGLDEHMRLRRGDVTIVSGVPGAGKTTAVNEFFCRLAKSRGFRTIWASFEQRAKPDHRRNLRTFYAEKLEKDMTAEEKAAADKWIDAHFRFLVPDDDTEASLDWLLQTLGAAVSRFDPFACVIDPWNALEHTRPPGMTQTEYTGISIERIKRFARRRRVHMLVVAHPTKLQRLQNGEYPRPNLWDIADSAHWANKADLGVMIWRKTGDPETEIAVVKSKYHNELGRPGSIRGIFDETKARLTVTNDGAGMR
jgi:twinkle protein